ncbi:hypothetical protein [Streptomyces hydrogenans]|uniref:hypothetical protein n=1 Tax=Streptomyces hydrogenans TaxID=1873719 RepID=UPI003820AC0E
MTHDDITHPSAPGIPHWDSDDWTDTDPTLPEVQALAAWLKAQLPGAAHSAADPSAGELIDTLHVHLATTVTTTLTATAAEEAHQVAEAMERLRAGSGVLAMLSNRLIPSAYRLLRTARQAATGGCRLGGTDTCSSPDRLTVWSYDAFGHNAEDLSCPRHAAELATGLDHGGELEVVLVGPRKATAKALAYINGRLEPTPHTSSVPPHLTPGEDPA